MRGKRYSIRLHWSSDSGEYGCIAVSAPPRCARTTLSVMQHSGQVAVGAMSSGPELTCAACPQVRGTFHMQRFAREAQNIAKGACGTERFRRSCVPQQVQLSRHELATVASQRTNRDRFHRRRANARRATRVAGAKVACSVEHLTIAMALVV